jgi:arginine decarboxylase
MALEDPLAKHEAQSGEIHANPTQLRFDMWSRIRQAAERLASGEGGNPIDLQNIIRDCLIIVEPWERYFTFPGPTSVDHIRHKLESKDYELLAAETARLDRLLSELGDAASALPNAFDLTIHTDELIKAASERHYFTVLRVDTLSPYQLQELRQDLHRVRHSDDKFIYELLHLGTFEDALAAVISNPQIQAVWVRGDIPLRSDLPLGFFRRHTDLLQKLENETGVRTHGPALAETIHERRPELDLYQTIEADGSISSPEEQALFRRSFYRREHSSEIHMATLDGIRQRYATPFFDALKEYARRPIGNFHALPIARGNSVFNSEWIQDMGEFYGEQIFMAETSSTVGGLDSLLAPKGSIREAQESASRAFGSKETYFATNGTSSSNKIVVQALCRPGDVVLIDRDCHKSHHYGLVMAGAHPIYLDAYPIQPLAIYGAVPIRSIKEQLLELKRAGRLDAVRMLLLTNCTFDGIVYHPLKVMREVLAIKPDMVFLWDEAWFAFAQLHPIYRRRTAMRAAAQLRQELDSPQYRAEYEKWKTEFDSKDPDQDATWLDQPLLPDPDVADIRVYSTQSTHKSLSALRQGSMIHQWDEKFASEVEAPFQEAYFTHTTTSPNYQIVASLDLARRQVELEGYGKISAGLQMALEIREIVNNDPSLNRYFRFLDPSDMIPAEHRESGLEEYINFTAGGALVYIADAWVSDEFTLDPTRLTLYLANTGMTGDEFKVGALMDKYGIQVNKTSINTVLLMTNIGTTWSAVDYLLQALRSIAKELDQAREGASPAEVALYDRKVDRLTNKLPPLPDFSRFHDAFRPNPDTPEGDMRAAYFLAYKPSNHEYVPLEDAIRLIREGRELVACSFIIPYPPGFPILVPGQVVSLEIVKFMQELDIDEIHGYRAELGLPVFTEETIAKAESRSTVQRSATKKVLARNSEDPGQHDPDLHIGSLPHGDPMVPVEDDSQDSEQSAGQ